MGKRLKMSAIDRRTLGFVRALLAGGQVSASDNGLFKVHRGGKSFSLPKARINDLVSAGVIARTGEQITSTANTRTWVKRQLSSGDDAFSNQHRKIVADRTGVSRNLEESPLKRLANAAGQGGKPYLLPHQIVAGERLARLVECAQLRTRVTMAYTATNPGQAKGHANITKDLSDQGLDARRQLDHMQQALPAECAGVVMDVCGFEKGLQLVERERGWPRRSAKLVLRIGLEQLATHFGLNPAATGLIKGRHRAWMANGSRPDKFG